MPKPTELGFEPQFIQPSGPANPSDPTDPNRLREIRALIEKLGCEIEIKVAKRESIRMLLASKDACVPEIGWHDFSSPTPERGETCNCGKFAYLSLGYCYEVEGDQ